jgi:hypothetical protein
MHTHLLQPDAAEDTVNPNQDWQQVFVDLFGWCWTRDVEVQASKLIFLDRWRLNGRREAEQVADIDFRLRALRSVKGKPRFDQRKLMGVN